MSYNYLNLDIIPMTPRTPGNSNGDRSTCAIALYFWAKESTAVGNFGFTDLENSRSRGSRLLAISLSFSNVLGDINT
jgi:hypothetical protein